MAEQIVYPDAHPETYTFDGFMYSDWNAWSTVRNAANSDPAYTKDDTASSTGGACVGTRYVGSNQYMIARSILLFRYNIPSNATILSAKLSIYVQPDSFTNNDNDGKDYIGVVESAPASNTAIATGDYDSLGNTLLAGAIDFSALTQSAYNDFVFNATGISKLIKDGNNNILKLGLKEGHDIEDHAPVGTNQIQFYFADNGSNKPKLTIEYSVPGLGKFLQVF